jgi:hypothetical protein
VREQLEALGGGEFVYGNPAEQMMDMNLNHYRGD